MAILVQPFEWNPFHNFAAYYLSFFYPHALYSIFSVFPVIMVVTSDRGENNLLKAFCVFLNFIKLVTHDGQKKGA